MPRGLKSAPPRSATWLIIHHHVILVPRHGTRICVEPRTKVIIVGLLTKTNRTRVRRTTVLPTCERGLTVPIVGLMCVFHCDHGYYEDGDRDRDGDMSVGWVRLILVRVVWRRELWITNLGAVGCNREPSKCWSQYIYFITTCMSGRTPYLKLTLH